MGNVELSGSPSKFYWGSQKIWVGGQTNVPLDFAKRGEQVISLYTQYLGGKQSLVSTVGF